MTWEMIHGDARRVSELVEPASVDLIITSPPYFAVRSYRDGGEHYDGQLGSEATPTEFVDALISCTRDWLTVLRPGGSIFVNLGDKRAGSGGHNNNGLGASSLNHGRGGSNYESGVNGPTGHRATRRNAPDRYNQSSDGIPAKSLMGLPWRYALRCVDELGLILRADIVWSKPNGLPDSVTDRVRQSHEYWFHLTREPRYFAAVDEIREEYSPASLAAYANGGLVAAIGDAQHPSKQNRHWRPGDGAADWRGNPLGKLPGSVWTIPTEPLTVPDEVGVAHFAAFPSEWPRRLILGWSPSGWCVACGEPRRPVVERTFTGTFNRVEAAPQRARCAMTGGVDRVTLGRTDDVDRRILGYRCACPTPDAPTTPSRILDPFCGTGTTVAVAHHLGRHGIGVDLSRDYLCLAEWRCTSDTRLRDRVLERAGLPKAPAVDGQLSLLDEAAS